MSPDPQDRAERLDSDMLEGEAGLDEDVREDIPPDRPRIIEMDPPPGDAEGELDGPGAEPGMRLADPADTDVDSVDDEPDAVASLADPLEDQDDLSPEEAAVHRTADPPMGRDGDGYV